VMMVVTMMTAHLILGLEIRAQLIDGFLRRGDVAGLQCIADGVEIVADRRVLQRSGKAVLCQRRERLLRRRQIAGLHGRQELAQRRARIDARGVSRERA